ncbi:TraE/TraK family type IV conjugative transfer system protein [Brevundimonas nasdae]|uniref:TraE/TraK family type IV conjugative transfer system protein n=1 Tax=Brevundimonas nasdae TaxID=172043 RepID=UPI003F68E3E0
MKSVNVNNQARVLNRRLTAVSGLLALSLVANAGLAVAVASMNKVILVPSLTDTVEVSAHGGIDRDYLERLARDATYLFLNRTPESARYFERNLERITEPDTYQEIKSALILDRQEREKTRTSQVFFPTDFYVDPSKLYVEVLGDIQTTNGTRVVETKRMTYGLTFNRHGSMVRLASFVPVEKDKAEGARAPVANKEEQL